MNDAESTLKELVTAFLLEAIRKHAPKIEKQYQADMEIFDPASSMRCLGENEEE